MNSIYKKMLYFLKAPPEAEHPEPQGAVQKYLSASGFPPIMCAHERYFGTGEEFFGEMIRKIKDAKKYILLEFFIIEDGNVWRQTEQLLAAKVREGLRVCLIIDDAGCLFTKPKGFEKRTRALGIELRKFNPVTPRITSTVGYRSHRKLVICDGETAFCCGLNLSDEYVNIKEKYGRWKDSGIMVTGGAAAQFTHIFLNMWAYLGGKNASFITEDEYEQKSLVQPFSSSPFDDKSTGLFTYISLINSARESVYLTTPYLVCSEEMLNALRRAALRGVSVRIITPRIPDKKLVFMLTQSFYGELLRTGAKIYEYAPGFIHAKNLLIDGETAVVGTINYDFRSMYLLFECGCVFYGGDVPKQLYSDLNKTISECVEITLEKLPKKNFFVELALGILHLFAPLV